MQKSEQSYRMRLGVSDRGIATAGLICRRKAAELRQLAKERGWLNKGPLSDDSGRVECLRPKKTGSSIKLIAGCALCR